MGSFPETKIYPFCFQVNRPINEAGRGGGALAEPPFI